jgi:sensor histidine kinase YesM
MAAFMSQQNWFIKYKLYHIPFWLLYSYLLWSVEIGSLYQAAQEYFFSVYAIKCFFYVLFPALAVYFNLYFLIPRFLQRRRYGWYLLLLALTIIASSALIVPGYYVCAWIAGSSAGKMFGLTGWNSFYHLARGEPLKNTIAAITLGMSIKLAKNWIETQRRHQALEKEKLETELKFLKYQFNPHFLFNSINSIFFLIPKNPDMASASLAKFSDLLRYQLYECDDSYISLDKEIGYLQNFIELEKLRQSKLDIHLSIDCDQPAEYMLSPFILITFVENAFKHVSRHSNLLNRIDIRLQTKGQGLHFFVANSTEADKTRQAVKYSGIGLKNVRRRLDLVYPGKYDLSIKDEEGVFEVYLDLLLTTQVFEPQ